MKRDWQSDELKRVRSTYRVILCNIGNDPSYRDKRTQQLPMGPDSQFDGFRRQAEKRLRILEAATALRDLAHCQVTGLKPFQATVRASTAYGSTNRGAYASSGRRVGTGLKTSR